MKRLTFWSFVCFLILLLSLGSLSVAESFLNDSQPFLDALRQEAETFSFSDADLAAVIDTQDSHAEAFLRNDEGAFEIAIPGAGRLFISEQEIGLEADGQRYIVDLASISQRIQQWTGRDGSREADRAFLQSLLVKFWDDVILPGVRFSEIGESITLHIQLDQGSLSQRADQYLREVLEMPETAELYDRYAPLFRLSQAGLPGSFSEFRKGLEAAPQETPASGFPSLEADLVIHSGLGGKKEISCIGTLYDADLYSCQLKVVFRELEGGWSCRGELTGGRDYTSRMNLDLLFRDGLLSGSASAGSANSCARWRRPTPSTCCGWRWKRRIDGRSSEKPSPGNPVSRIQWAAPCLERPVSLPAAAQPGRPVSHHTPIYCADLTVSYYRYTFVTNL